MEFRILKPEENLPNTFLENFIRYEVVERAWRFENGKYVLKNVSYIEEWNEEELESIIEGFRKTLKNNGFVVVMSDNSAIKGFASVEGESFGSNKEYNNLSMLHVSADVRGKSYGKALFDFTVQQAIILGMKKLYISASSCERAQSFYRNQDCTFAEEINTELAEKEPYDVQLEFKLENRHKYQ